MLASPNLITYSSIDSIKEEKKIDRAESLKAIYDQLFKENRNFDFFHNESIDSAFLAGELTARQFVRELLCSEMYRDYILGVNSNYHFVQICFERVLGRPPVANEKYEWSSLLATEGLRAFAEKFTSTQEYLDSFGENGVPNRRSFQLFSSKQCTPALPKEQSLKRYTGPGIVEQMYGGVYGSIWKWEGGMPPKKVRKIAAVLTVAGSIEVARVLLTIALAAITGSSF